VSLAPQQPIRSVAD
jgi:WD40 repeat protein